MPPEGHACPVYAPGVVEILVAVLVLALASAVMLVVTLYTRVTTGRRLRRIEERLAAVTTRLGAPEQDLSEVVTLVEGGRSVI